MIAGILRILFWFAITYVILTIVRSVVTALFPPARRSQRADGRVHRPGEPEKQSPEKYDDVKDAHFSDLPPDSSRREK